MRPSDHEENTSRRPFPPPLPVGCPDSMAVDHRQAQHPHHHHPLSPEITPTGGHIFALIYSLIFSVVHAVLTTVFTPILGSSDESRRQQHQTPSFSAVRHELSPPPRSLLATSHGHVTREHIDPELAIVDINNGGGDSVSSDKSSFHQPMHTVPSTSTGVSPRTRSWRNCVGSHVALSSVDENKDVIFPTQGRIRPPLGRIERLSSLTSVNSGSSSISSSSTASTSSSSRHAGRERSRLSHYPITPNVPPRSFKSDGSAAITSSPFRRMTSPRMTHSTYFLE